MLKVSYSCCKEANTISPDSRSTNEVVMTDTKITLRDRLVAILVRLDIGRSSFRVEPGLYGIGSPNADSPVFVSANYRLSFDILKSSLSGMNAYILVLDTKGINVWCAAGKGTFGTCELVTRIESAGLPKRVNHRKIILPQLGAPGIKAHEVEEKSGFTVIFGPVRAKDIPAFMENGSIATPEMRRVSFDIRDRLVLTSVELVQSFKFALLAIPVFLILGFIRDGGVHVSHLLESLPFFGAVITGAFFMPVLLPWIPGRAFAFKGWILGMLYTAIVSYVSQGNPMQWISNMLLLPAVSSFISLNFTGATTFTSLSGVEKEMKIWIPLLAISFIAGIILTGVRFFIA
jgi:hypothetical protein